MTTKIYKAIIACSVCCCFTATTTSCSDQLDLAPQGEFTAEQLTDESIEGLMSSAYQGLEAHFFDDNNAAFAGPITNWVFDVRSDDAYKGGEGVSMEANIHQLEIQNIASDNPTCLNKWENNYLGIARVHKAMQAINDASNVNDKDALLGELKTLRAWFYFDLNRIFRSIPYFTENDDPKTVTNGNMSRDEIYAAIKADLESAYAVMHESQDQPGRFTKYVAAALLCKVNAQTSTWSEVEKWADVVINSGNMSIRNNLLLGQNGTGTLTINGEGDMYDYEELSPFDSHVYESPGIEDDIVSVIIEYGITSIGSTMFYYCCNLTNITMPNSITRIGNSAFSGCSGLTDIYYSGTEDEWYSINVDINNGSLTGVTIHCSDVDITDYQIPNNSSDPDEPEERNVKSISFIPAQPYEFIENADGYWSYYWDWGDELGNEVKVDYFYYVGKSHSIYDFIYENAGNKVTVEYKDGSTDEFTNTEYKYSYVSSNGEEIYLTVDENQQEKPWKVGNENYFTVGYSNVTTQVPVTIIENPILSVEYTPIKPITLIENYEGYDEGDWFEYNYPDFKKGDKFVVNYKSGEKEEYSAQYVENYGNPQFVDNEGAVLEKQPKLYANQNETHWTVGTDNYMDFTYIGASTKVPVTIIENPVDSIEFKLASPIVLYENQGGYYMFGEGDDERRVNKDENGYYYETYNHEIEDYEKIYVKSSELFYFYSDISASKNGNKLIVHYKDGSKKVLTQKFFYNDKNKGYYLIDENGTIDDYNIIFNWNITLDKPFVLGSDNYARVTYLNKTTQIPITVEKNSIDHIEYIPKSPITFSVDDEKEYYYWSDGDYEEKAFNYGKIYETGNKLKVYFKDGSSTTFNFYNKLEKYEPVVGWRYYAVDENGCSMNYASGINTLSGIADDEDWTIGNTYEITMNYFGATTTIPVSIISDSISHIHSYTTQVVAPTCTEQGYTIYTCSCGDTYNDNYVNALGHTEVVDKAVAPTCTVKGKAEGKHCSVCNKVLVAQTEVAALGHKWDSGKVTKKATPTATGVKTYTCSVCGTTKKETIAKCAKYVNPIKASGKTATVKFKNLKKKNQTVSQKNAFSVSKAQGKVTYKKSSGNKSITVSSAGKITVKKGLKKGTYKIKIKVTAAGNNTYKKGTKTVTVTIKVK